MTHTILVLVVFLLSGEPQAYAATLSPDVVCDAAQAVSFANQVEVHLREPIQEEILWQCLPVRSPGPTAAPDTPPRRRIPGENEAQTDKRILRNARVYLPPPVLLPTVLRLA